MWLSDIIIIIIIIVIINIGGGGIGGDGGGYGGAGGGYGVYGGGELMPFHGESTSDAIASWGYRVSKTWGLNLTKLSRSSPFFRFWSLVCGVR